MADRFNRHRYEKRKLPYPEKRLAFVRMSGAAWRKFSGPEYRSFRHQAMLRTGNLITADGSADSEIRPEGLPAYRPPPVGTAVKKRWLPTSRDAPLENTVGEEAQEEDADDPDSSDSSSEEGDESESSSEEGTEDEEEEEEDGGKW